MRKLGLFLILAIFIHCGTISAEEVTLALDETISIALRDNRDVLLKTEDVKRAKEKIAEAQAGLLPTLNFTGSWTDTRGYYSNELRQTTTQTTLKQYLYKGGETINTIEQNKYKLKVSRALLDKTKLEIVLSVKKAFYTLLLAREFADLNKGILNNTQEHLDSIKTRYQNGLVSESDVLKMELSLSSVIEAYEASLNQAEASSILLNNLLYLDENAKIKPDGQFTYEPREVAIDEALLKAMESRPEIKQYEAQEKVDQKAIEISKADNRPSIYASWDYYSRSHLSATTQENWNDYNIIGLTFSWPIFDGWATRHKVEQAIIDLKETQLLKEKAVKDIALELKDAYLSLKNVIVKFKTAEADIAVYKDRSQNLEQKYNKGMASLLDKEDADLSYQIATFNKKQAIYDYIIAKSEFDKATGGL